MNNISARAHREQFHKEVKKNNIVLFCRVAIPIIVVVLFVVFMGYLFFFSSLFSIRTIRVKGNTIIPTSSLEHVLSAEKGENIFLASGFEQRLEKKFPLIQTITVDRQLLHILIVTIHEYPPSILIQNPDKTYVYSSNGILVDTVSNASTRYTLPLVVTQERNSNSIPVSTIAIDVGYIEGQKDQFVTAFEFVPSSTLIAHYAKGYSVYYSLSKNITKQVSDVRQIERNFGAGKCSNIDVRYDNIYCKEE